MMLIQNKRYQQPLRANSPLIEESSAPLSRLLLPPAPNETEVHLWPPGPEAHRMGLQPLSNKVYILSAWQQLVIQPSLRLSFSLFLAPHLILDALFNL